MDMIHRFRPLLAPALIAAALTACDDGALTAPVLPEDSVPGALTRTTTLGSLQDQASTGTLRVEIEVQVGGPPWVAREIEIENDADNEEKIESRIVAADATARTIQLLFGDLVIDLSAASRFRAEGAGDVDRDDFFSRVDAALSAGLTPGVELRRNLPATAQAPDDPTFVPRDVRLDNDADVGKLELLIDARHVTTDSDARGRITVFGIEISVDPSQGSEVGRRSPDGDGAVEIEGLVETVDLASGTVRLVGGTIVRIVEGTRFDVDDSDHLGSLAEVAAALADGHWVEMEAEAVSDGDGAWIAVEVEFEIEDDADDDLPGSAEFEDDVAAVDAEAGTFTLTDGRVLTVTAETRIDDEGDLRTLQQVAGALTAGLVVEAEGHLMADPGAPGGLRLLSVKFETDDDDD